MSGRRDALAIRLFDVLAAALGLAVLAPFMALIAALVKLDSPGPAFFRQTRVGYRGRPFTIYKFRTMTAPAGDRLPVGQVRDFETYVFSVPGDEARLTRVGRALRRTSMDELPQLWNVLKGEMSLVGPRPDVPEIVAQYPPEYHGRHAVRPGITGLAQVNGRNELTYRETIHYDLIYAERPSLAGNLRILIRTIGAVISGRGAR